MGWLARSLERAAADAGKARIGDEDRPWTRLDAHPATGLAARGPLMEWSLRVWGPRHKPANQPVTYRAWRLCRCVRCQQEEGPTGETRFPPVRGFPHGHMTYVELHCHSAYSFLDGASHPEELAAQAANLG